MTFEISLFACLAPKHSPEPWEEVSDDEVMDAIRSLPTHWVDLVQTAANVLISSGGQQLLGTAGAAQTIVAGDVIYLDPTTQTWIHCDATIATGTALKSGVGAVFGIALDGASAGQPISVFAPIKGAKSQINIGATLVVGTMYIVSVNNAGKVCALADFATTGMWLSELGVGVTTSLLEMGPEFAFNIQHA